MAAADQTFRRYGAKLETTSAPYDPFAKVGDPNDSAWYVLQPGVNFMRPWIAVRNGPAFQFPLGLEGFTLAIDPTLGTHKFIGDNKVVIDVIHAGEEHFTMTGNFPGDSAPDLMQALRDVVYQVASDEGKILYVPEIMTHAQRVQVVHAEFGRSEDQRGRDATYSIEFVRMGLASINPDDTSQPATPQPTTRPKGRTTHSVNVDAKHNTLRKIAAWKLGSSSKWRTLYRANEAWFNKRNITIAKAPGYRLPLGAVIHY